MHINRRFARLFCAASRARIETRLRYWRTVRLFAFPDVVKPSFAVSAWSRRSCASACVHVYTYKRRRLLYACARVHLRMRGTYLFPSRPENTTPTSEPELLYCLNNFLRDHRFIDIVKDVLYARQYRSLKILIGALMFFFLSYSTHSASFFRNIYTSREINRSSGADTRYKSILIFCERYSW